MKVIEGNYLASDARITLLVARFNSFVVESLVAGALDTLKRHGVSDEQIQIVRAPGAWELPLVARKLVDAKAADAIVALGAVIRGGTPHFDFVAGECAKGLACVSLDSGIPIAFGVLTTDSIEQSIERAGTKAGNKGSDAAMTVLEMLSLLSAIQEV